MKYRYTDNNLGSESIVLYFSDEDLPIVIASSHPKFYDLYDSLDSGDLDNMTEWDVKRLLRSNEESTSLVEDWTDDDDEISSSVYYTGVTLNGTPIPDEVNEGLNKLLSNFDSESEDQVQAIVNFLDLAEQSEHGIATGDFLRWAMRNGIVLTKEGMVVGYKSLIKVEEDDYDTYFGEATASNGDLVDLKRVLPEGVENVYRPSFQGPGITNGVEWEKYIPMFVGATVEMPADKVDSNGSVECSVGLHVGNYRYASMFNYRLAGNAMSLVLVDPRDIISVPDYDFDKYRVSRYRMIAEGVSGELDASLYLENTYEPVFEEPEPEPEPELDPIAGFEEDEVVQEFKKGSVLSRLMSHLGKMYGSR